MYNRILIIGLGLILSIISGCGNATMEPQNASYEPRLVIEAFLIAGQPVDRIYITRNFTIDTDLTTTSLIPDPEQTDVTLTHLESGSQYALTFYHEEIEGTQDAYWHYNGNDLVILKGHSYQLNVQSVIEGGSLAASAVTTVPEAGFAIASINTTQLKYRQTDPSGNLQQFELGYTRSPRSHFYVAAIQALNPRIENFIFDNPYQDVKPEDVDLTDDSFSYEVAHHTPVSAGASNLALSWHAFKFYDNYQVILYACDENYKDFLITYGQVMEMDGNFHEAKFNIEGDGIGVFGSMIADTVACSVIP